MRFCLEAVPLGHGQQVVIGRKFDDFANEVTIRAHAITERGYDDVVWEWLQNLGRRFTTYPAAIELNRLGPDSVKTEFLEFFLRPGNDALIALGAHATRPNLGSYGFDNVDRQVVVQCAFSQNHGLRDDIGRNYRRVDRVVVVLVLCDGGCCDQCK